MVVSFEENSFASFVLSRMYSIKLSDFSLSTLFCSSRFVFRNRHDDVIADASSLQYARSFTPSYSIFIVLQNTTKEIGATGVCPGSHVCAVNPDFCPEYGFQLVSNETQHWKAGGTYY